MKASRAYRVEEVSGNVLVSREKAQQGAADPFADALTKTIRQMLQDEYLIVQNGQIIPAHHRK